METGRSYGYCQVLVVLYDDNEGKLILRMNCFGCCCVVCAETHNRHIKYDHFKIKLRYVNPEIAFQSLFAFTHKWQESEIPLRELFTYLK